MFPVQTNRTEIPEVVAVVVDMDIVSRVNARGVGSCAAPILAPRA